MSKTSTCRTCGASLAPDQRYCLSCGTRVASPRLDFIAEAERVDAQAPAGGGAEAPTAAQPIAGVPVAVAAAVPPAAPAGPPSKLDRIGGPMGAAAVVLVALGVGFLIGQGGEEAPVAQRAPVVNIQGGLPTSAPTGTVDGAAADPAADAGGATGTGGANGGRSGGRRAAPEDVERVVESTRDIPKSTGSDAGGDLNRLRREPVETATPGAPPPRDNRPAGGGTEAATFG